MKKEKDVAKTYQIIADWFDQARTRDLSFEEHYLTMVVNLLSPGAQVLDLGCGMGEPIAQFFAQRGFNLTGVDFSERLLQKARTYVPNAIFHLHDMRTLDLQKKFDAIILWHSLFHLTGAEQKEMFATIAAHAHTGTILLFTSHHEEVSEIWSDNGGQLLFHASLALSDYETLLEAHHFKVLHCCVEDPKAGDTTVWVAQYFGS